MRLRAHRELLDEILNPRVVLRARITLDKIEEVFSGFVVAVLDELLDHISAYELEFGFAADTERGIDIHTAVELPKDALAKAVYSTDLRAVQKHLLAQKSLVVGLTVERLTDLGGESLAHLGRCRSGEGHDKKTVNIRTVRCAYEPEDLLDEDTGLACARCREHFHVLPARFKYLKLFGTPPFFRHIFFLLVCILFHNCPGCCDRYIGLLVYNTIPFGFLFILLFFSCFVLQPYF